MVEVRRIELLSEDRLTAFSPSAVYILDFPFLDACKRAFGIGSFILPALPQSLGRPVPHINDAACRSRERSGVLFQRFSDPGDQRRLFIDRPGGCLFHFLSPCLQDVRHDPEQIADWFYLDGSSRGGKTEDAKLRLQVRPGPVIIKRKVYDDSGGESMLECTDLRHPLTPAERHVVDYLNDNIADIASLSIGDIAEGAFVSNATVSRAIRKCGFSSFIAARFHLAQEHAATANQIQANRVLAECYEECVRTVEMINVNDILTAAQHILQAPRVIVLTRSISRGVAEYFCVQLISLKCNAMVICDSEIMERMDEFLKPDDLVIEPEEIYLEDMESYARQQLLAFIYGERELTQEEYDKFIGELNDNFQFDVYMEAAQEQLAAYGLV